MRLSVYLEYSRREKSLDDNVSTRKKWEGIFVNDRTKSRNLYYIEGWVGGHAMNRRINHTRWKHRGVHHRPHVRPSW